MVFSTKRESTNVPRVKLSNVTLSEVFTRTHLGLTLQSDLSWDKHICGIISKATKHIGLLKRVKYTASRRALTKCYLTFVRPLVENGDLFFDSCTGELSDKLEAVNLEAACIATDAK